MLHSPPSSWVSPSQPASHSPGREVTAASLRPLPGNECSFGIGSMVLGALQAAKSTERCLHPSFSDGSVYKRKLNLDALL